jgi:hypothetical protein
MTRKKLTPAVPLPHARSVDLLSLARALSAFSRAGIPARYLYNLCYSIDQFCNTVLGGDPDETISSRLGKLRRRNSGVIPWSRPVSRAVASLLDALDPGHCASSIEDDRGGRAILNGDTSPPPRSEPLDTPHRKCHSRRNPKRRKAESCT